LNLHEPTSALDVKNQIIILNLIRRLCHEHGLTVVFTTHHPHHALAIADESLLMFEHGAGVCGRSDDVLTEENLHALYGVDLKRVEFMYGDRLRQTLVPVIAPNRAT
jgi:iron complex transport system ATP-binding protein